MRERGIFFALLAGMGAITYHSTYNPEPNTKQVPAIKSASARSGDSASELAKTFEKFDKLHKFTITSAPNGLHMTVTAGSVPDVPKYDWALAIVSDPEHSHLKLYFDRELEAIQWAAAKAGYQFERYWLPWKTEAPSARDTSYELSPTENDSNDKSRNMRIAPERDDRAGLPGVLLFHHDLARPLAVFLVSESPTAGVAPEEFRNAVHLGQCLQDFDCRQGQELLRIIGPGFSGSLASLSTLIKTQFSFTKVLIRTMTNDDASNKRFSKSMANTDFNTLGVGSIKTTRRFIHYVRDKWRDYTPVLLLTEEATALGGGLGGVTTGSGVTSKQNDELGIIYIMPFPRNLSQLRNASEKQDHLPGLADTSRRLDVPRNGLWMSLKQESSADLEIPAFSKEQTPISQESVLFTIEGLLKTGGIHYAGVYATDPLDVLFLSRFLRSACPNIRVFTTNPDLLLEHGSDSSDYSGILGLSTFSLIPLSQLWSADNVVTSLYVFPDEMAEAIYNAALEILRDVPDNSIYNHPLKDIDRDVIDPFSGSTETVWLTVAGRGEFEPIAVLNRDTASTAPRVGSFPPEYWPGWGYVFIVISSFCFAFCALTLFALPTGRRSLAFFTAQLDTEDLSEIKDLTERKDAVHSTFYIPRAFYLFAIGMSLSTLLAIWTAVPVFILQWNVTSNLRLEAIGLLLIAAGASAVFALRFSVAVPILSAKPKMQPAGAAPSYSVGTASAFAVSVPMLWAAIEWLQPPLRSHATSVLPHLWWFFLIGCACFGATTAASTLPFWNILELKMDPNTPKLKAAIKAAMKFFPRLHWLGVGAVALFAVTVHFVGAKSIALHAPADFLAAYRSLDLTNGVSPLVPFTLLFIALAILAFVQLRRVTYCEERRPEVPEMSDSVHPTLTTLVNEINNRVRNFTLHPAHWLLFVILALFSIRLIFGPAQTLESLLLEKLMVFTALGVGTFVVLIWIRLILVWSAFSEFLQQLERHPIRQVFSLLPKGFIWSPAWQGGGKKRTHVAITRSVECMHALVYHPETPPWMKWEIREELDKTLENDVKSLLEGAAARRRISRATYRSLEESLQTVAGAAVRYLNGTTWKSGDYEVKTELASKEETKDALHVSSTDYKLKEPATICGELVAFRFLAFINFILWHIDNLVTYISIGFLLLVIALNSYAFRSRTSIAWMMTILFIVLTAGIVTVFAQADRDGILSRITGTEEGKLDRHFFTHLISYGGVPALVLLATHFPVVGKFFFSWVKPALEAIH